MWRCADEVGKWVPAEELAEWVTIFPDHLEVTVAGAPALNVLYSEVGLMGSEIVGVGEPTSTIRLAVRPVGHVDGPRKDALSAIRVIP